jgi:hypothetical protein
MMRLRVPESNSGHARLRRTRNDIAKLRTIFELPNKNEKK